MLPDIFGFILKLDSRYDRVGSAFERHLFYLDLNHRLPPLPSHDEHVGADPPFAIIPLFVPILQCTTFRGFSLIFPLQLLNFVTLRRFQADFNSSTLRRGLCLLVSLFPACLASNTIGVVTPLVFPLLFIFTIQRTVLSVILTCC